MAFEDSIEEADWWLSMVNESRLICCDIIMRLIVMIATISISFFDNMLIKNVITKKDNKK